MTGFPRTAVPAAPVGPEPFRIRIVSAALAPAKPDGMPWDGDNSGPDTEVTVRVEGAGTGSVVSTMVRDSTSPQWNQSGDVTINRGDRLVISIVDKDLMEHDAIATWTESFQRPGRMQLTAPARSVQSLVIEVAAR